MTFEKLTLSWNERVLTITMNSPATLNAVGPAMHRELAEVFDFARLDPESDVVVLTGAGRAFSAGGDIGRMEEVIANPDLFDTDIRDARRIVFSLLELDKPIIAKVNGHAVGLGATLALFCDVIIAAETAKIGDPHVSVGLVAGDGGAIIWPQLIGFARAKEYLLTGELMTAVEAARMGLINHAVPAAELEARVDVLSHKLVEGATAAIKWTKVVTNMELKRIAHAALDAGIAYEALTVRTIEHRHRVAALRRAMS